MDVSATTQLMATYHWVGCNVLFETPTDPEVYFGTKSMAPSQYKDGLSRYGDFHNEYKTVVTGLSFL